MQRMRRKLINTLTVCYVALLVCVACLVSCALCVYSHGLWVFGVYQLRPVPLSCAPLLLRHYNDEKMVAVMCLCRVMITSVIVRKCARDVSTREARVFRGRFLVRFFQHSVQHFMLPVFAAAVCKSDDLTREAREHGKKPAILATL